MSSKIQFQVNSTGLFCNYYMKTIIFLNSNVAQLKITKLNDDGVCEYG